MACSVNEIAECEGKVVSNAGMLAKRTQIPIPALPYLADVLARKTSYRSLEGCRVARCARAGS